MEVWNSVALSQMRSRNENSLSLLVYCIGFSYVSSLSQAFHRPFKVVLLRRPIWPHPPVSTPPRSTDLYSMVPCFAPFLPESTYARHMYTCPQILTAGFSKGS
ncbi:hypothetical protein K439DRAFT_246886 [Ramaria rubella]|nr:hypothetical protein K439DRAFT_246886 [Ramaria rubella]